MPTTVNSITTEGTRLELIFHLLFKNLVVFSCLAVVLLWLRNYLSHSSHFASVFDISCEFRINLTQIFIPLDPVHTFIPTQIQDCFRSFTIY